MNVSRRLTAWISVLSLMILAILGVVALALRLVPSVAASPAQFQIAPYLQPGDDPDGGHPVLVWQTDDREARWSVELKEATGADWAATQPPAVRRIVVADSPAFRLHRATLVPATEEPPKAMGRYRVSRGGVALFEAPLPALKAPGMPERFVVFGDGAADTAEQRAIAAQAFQARPDYAVLTGDLVYTSGRASEYRNHFFPVYNADGDAPSLGAPLLRSILCYAAPGNHDLHESNLDQYPDALAYFYYWVQPHNGPVIDPGAAGAPPLKGSPERRQAFLKAAGPAYPRMANFSFDRGAIHWTVLDSNPYVDWTDTTLRGWLEADLAGPEAQRAAWRIVAFHHPPFHSSKAHASDQQMRVLAPVFEKAGVALVFSGHVHNYQRSRPLKFMPANNPSTSKLFGPDGQVGGRWTLDRVFDGAAHSKPDGVIYVVTGAGGARLYDTDQHDHPETWHDFTARFVSNVHSFTVVDATADTLNLRQVSAQGDELDRVVITRE